MIDKMGKYRNTDAVVSRQDWSEQFKHGKNIQGEVSKPGEQEQPPKLVYLEILRIVACFFVIVNHTCGPLYRDRGPSLTWFGGIAYFFICKIAVPLFLMITGALLLPKTDSPQKTAARLLRAGAVLVIASAFYYVCYGVSNGDALSAFDFLGKVFKTRVITPLWYLYLYFGLLCLLPILQKMVKALNKRDLQWVIFLSVGVLGIIPLVQTFIPLFGISEDFTGVLFSNYIGVFLCGYYIEQYVTVNRTMFWLSAAFFALSIGVQTVATYYFYQADPTNYLLLDNRILITITSASICFYMMVKYSYSQLSLGPKLENIVIYL